VLDSITEILRLARLGQQFEILNATADGHAQLMSVD